MAETTASVETHPTETVPVDELKPHPLNYREHPDVQLGHLQQSLREFGQYRNVVIARDGTILAGHGVYMAAVAMGVTTLEAIRMDLDPDDDAAIKLLTADNELARLAEIDDRKLSLHLKLLAESDDLYGSGFDAEMVANLVYITRNAAEVATVDEAAQWAGLEVEGPPRYAQLVVHCESEEFQQAFVEQLGLTVHAKNGVTWLAWWPSAPEGE